MARSVGDANILALAHVGMGAATGLEDLESARAHFVRALRLQKRAGNAGWVGVIHNNLANAELIAGNLEAARSNFQAGLAHSSSPYSRALSLVNLGTVCLLEGDDKSAKSCCCDALRLLVRAGVWGEIPYPLLNLAICASASEDFERSAVLHGAAAAMIEGHGISFEPAESALRERDIAALRGKMGDADYERSYARGYEMSRPDVIDVALS